MKPASKPILTTNCLIDSNGCSATMMFGLSVHVLFACTFRSLYSINGVVTQFVRVQSNLAAAETIQSKKKYRREQNVLGSFIARLFLIRLKCAENSLPATVLCRHRLLSERLRCFVSKWKYHCVMSASYQSGEVAQINHCLCDLKLCGLPKC